MNAFEFGLGILALLLLFKKGGGFQTPERGKQFDLYFNDATDKYGLPQGLLSSVAQHESNYDPNAQGTSGEIGLMQFMPATADELGINPADPMESIYGAAQYLKGLYNETGSWVLALAAYNWGIGNLQRKGLVNAPDVTKRYVASISEDIGLA